MVVKARIGRKRYIIFRIDATTDITKRDIIHTLNRSIAIKLTQIPWVITVKNNFGLVKCNHLDKEKIIELLQSIHLVGKLKIPVTIKTLGTTGTIRSARKKYLKKLNLYPLNNPKTF